MYAFVDVLPIARPETLRERLARLKKFVLETFQMEEDLNDEDEDEDDDDEDEDEDDEDCEDIFIEDDEDEDEDDEEDDEEDGED